MNWPITTQRFRDKSPRIAMVSIRQMCHATQQKSCNLPSPTATLSLSKVVQQSCATLFVSDVGLVLLMYAN